MPASRARKTTAQRNGNSPRANGWLTIYAAKFETAQKEAMFRRQNRESGSVIRKGNQFTTGCPLPWGANPSLSRCTSGHLTAPHLAELDVGLAGGHRDALLPLEALAVDLKVQLPHAWRKDHNTVAGRKSDKKEDSGTQARATG